MRNLCFSQFETKRYSLRQMAEKVQKRGRKALEKTVYEVQTASMTNKEIVQDLLRRIPDDASLQDIARELEFIAAVRQGLSELDNGDSIPIEEVEQELPSGIIR
jgi:predicted transcriptional regulator